MVDTVAAPLLDASEMEERKMAVKLDKDVKLIKDMNPSNVILVKMGSFCHVYGKDAYLLSYLFEYQLKIVDGTLSTCGFPASTIEKIEKDLEDKKINYMLVVKKEKYEVVEEKDFKGKNNYGDYADKAYKYIAKKKKVDGIYAYLLDNLNENDFQEKILKIEEIIY